MGLSNSQADPVEAGGNLLNANTISHSYPIGGGSLHVLDKVSLELRQGGVQAIVGPSGCGKTTLLKIIAGLLRQTAGTITINGAHPGTFRDNHRVVYMPQRTTLLPWRTAAENISLGLELLPGVADGERSKRTTEALEAVGLGDAADRYPAHLSGGMIQRTALARSLVLEPQLLLMDESFSAVDAITREQLWLLFAAIIERRSMSVLLVTHNVEEAVFLADEVTVLTRRPARVRSITGTGLARPRTRELLRSEEFTLQCRAIRSALEQLV